MVDFPCVMIKLENVGSLPQASSLLVIQSQQDGPAVSLTVETLREKNDGTGEWTESAKFMKQGISCYIDGVAVQLSAKVDHLEAVECAAAFKVVVEVDLKMTLSTAFEKGDRSKQFAQLNLVRVVEVWGSATKQLWSARKGLLGGNGESSRQPAAILGENGRIQKPVTA